MRKLTLDWTLKHTRDLTIEPVEEVPASVPGAVQLDYAKAKNYKPYYYGMNFEQFDWMEDEYFVYTAVLDFTAGEGEYAFLRFDGIDYAYEIRLDGVTMAKGEGFYTPTELDVTAYSGKKTKLEVIIYPIPKIPGMPRDRTQAAASCKPASCYGWDWHPRLVPSGIWEEAYVEILPEGNPKRPEVSYRLSDDLKAAEIFAEAEVVGKGEITAEILSPDGKTVAWEKKYAENGSVSFCLKIEKPLLWYPRGYGDQPIYTLRLTGADSRERKIGFRRSKLVRNVEDVKRFEKDFPKQPLPAPATLEINGQRIFAKGSNWVNTEIFPCLMKDERYDELLELAYKANMNILRLWGGQYINREHFFEKCDELGILVWQEFMLSCNLYPDEDHFLSVLRQEATSIVKRLRTHPCIAFWAGGNELFNSWSGMTSQSHPLRLLDSVCYEYDRFTPFNMASPMHGMAHGSYVKVTVKEGTDDPHTDDVKGEEFITVLKKCDYNTYTEFGCNGGATPEYLKKYIMDEATYQDCTPSNPVWTAHHAFKAWNGEKNWLGKQEVKYYFGSWDSMDDLMDKTLYLQAMAYKSMFEEMRRKWPYCSMAVNWDYNEPWPCAAGNSLVNWPAEPKPALWAVGEALRPTLLSACTKKNRFLSGETYEAEAWVLNDSPDPAEGTEIGVYLEYDGVSRRVGTVQTKEVASRSNGCFGSVCFPVTKEIPQRFSVALRSEAHPEWDSVYHYAKKDML